MERERICIYMCVTRCLSVQQDSCWNTHNYVADEGDIRPAGQLQVSAERIWDNFLWRQVCGRIISLLNDLFIYTWNEFHYMSFCNSLTLLSCVQAVTTSVEPASFFSRLFVSPLSHLDRQQTAAACELIMNCSLRRLFVAPLWKQSAASHWANKTAAFFKRCCLQVRQQRTHSLMEQFDRRGNPRVIIWC